LLPYRPLLLVTMAFLNHSLDRNTVSNLLKRYSGIFPYLSRQLLHLIGAYL